MDTSHFSEQERAEYYEELKALIGKNVQGYEHLLRPPAEIKALPKAEAKIENKKRFKLRKGAWLGLFMPIAFFWYRKLWLDGILILLGMMAFAVLFRIALDMAGYDGSPSLAGVYGGMTVFFGKEYVMWRYRKIVEKYRVLYPDREDRLSRLTARGGTSIIGGAAPYLLLIGFIVYVFAQP